MYCEQSLSDRNGKTLDYKVKGQTIRLPHLSDHVTALMLNVPLSLNLFDTWKIDMYSGSYAQEWTKEKNKGVRLYLNVERNKKKSSVLTANLIC